MEIRQNPLFFYTSQGSLLHAEIGILLSKPINMFITYVRSTNLGFQQGWENFLVCGVHEEVLRQAPVASLPCHLLMLNYENTIEYYAGRRIQLILLLPIPSDTRIIPFIEFKNQSLCQSCSSYSKLDLYSSDSIIQTKYTRAHQYHTQAVPLVGLVNNGNLCYFNSVFQILYHTKRFCQNLLSVSYKENNILSKMSSIFKKMINGTHNVSAYSAKNLLAERFPEFRGRNQENALEAFIAVIALVEESSPKLSELFKCTIRNEYCCQKCSHKWVNTQCSSVLFLPVNIISKNAIVLGEGAQEEYRLLCSEFDYETVLNIFSKNLHREDLIMYEFINGNFARIQEGEKNLQSDEITVIAGKHGQNELRTLYEAAKRNIGAQKRYSYNQRSYGQFQNSKKSINMITMKNSLDDLFGMKNCNLQCVDCGWVCENQFRASVDFPEYLFFRFASDISAINPNGEMVETVLDQKYTHGVKYELYGVIKHLGEYSGHYVACVLNLNTWYRISDSNFAEVTVKEVITGKALMLFYQRRDES